MGEDGSKMGARTSVVLVSASVHNGWMSSTDGGNPVIVRKQLGAALRKLREAAGLDRAHVATLLGDSEQKVERLERGGSARLKVRELGALLDEFGVTDEALRADCFALLRATSERGWWSPYTAALPRTMPTLLGFEAAASLINTFEAYVIPGLLQTEDYARAVMTAAVPVLSPGTIDGRIRVRLERQARLWADDGPILHAVIDEGALRRRIGGEDVWRAQLAQLGAVASHPRVTLQILPFDAAATPTVLGSFMLWHLDDGTWVSCVELKNGDRIDESDGAEVYRQVYARLRDESHGPARTARIINQIVKDET